VDSSDTSWALDRPSYRVHFWTRPAHSNASPTCTEFEITDTDIADVLGWAQRTAGARTFALYVVCDVDATRGLVRLAGAHPAQAAAPPAAWPATPARPGGPASSR
jgi:hypothetical protein